MRRKYSDFQIITCIILTEKKSDEAVHLKLFFDEIPDTKEQNDDFKAHLCYLQELQQFKKANIKIQHDDISEIDSHKERKKERKDPPTLLTAQVGT